MPFGLGRKFSDCVACVACVSLGIMIFPSTNEHELVGIELSAELVLVPVLDIPIESIALVPAAEQNSLGAESRQQRQLIVDKK